MALLYHRYLTGHFGYCPRALCDKQKVLPVGMNDKVRTSRVKIYCPRCDEIYVPHHKTRLDGASFGTAIAQMFLQTYPTVIVLPPRVFFYEPTIHGFKVAGKRGSKYFEARHEGIVDTRQVQEALD
jgi:casein kinase II subunit beta